MRHIEFLVCENENYQKNFIFPLPAEQLNFVEKFKVMAKSASEKINWVEGSLVETFGLVRVYEDFPLLNEWLKVENNLTPSEIKELEKRRSVLVRKYNSWNEETLKMKFIAFILDMVHYDTSEFEGIFDVELKE